MLPHVTAELRKTPSAEQNMGMPIGQERRWSVEDVWALPDDGNRYETVDGELLVTPAPRYIHQQVIGAIHHELLTWLRGPGKGIGIALMAPADVILDAWTLVQPDLFVLPPVGRAVMFGKEPAPQPLLVVEVLSPGTARNDRLKKRPRFQRAGIECWLVDIDSHIIERWTHDVDRPEVCIETVTWKPPGAQPQFRLELAPLWEEIDP
ncbi:MAG: Uma2 family endonuclease [Gemmatimonadaceae bacterium]|nr:Uma2 family endonuclease [Gemmatimonadaceae bacterium]